MKNFRKLSACLLVLAMSFMMLVSASAAGPALSDVEITEPVTITLWTSPDWAGIWEANEEGADFGDFYRYAAEEFMKENPNVTVDINIITTSAVEKFAVALQSNTLPDIYVNADFTMYDYVHAGLIEPLNDIVTEEDREDIAATFWDMVTTNGDVYVMPFFSETGHIAINTSIFDEYGINPADYIANYGAADEIGTWTPEEFKALLSAIKDKLPQNVYPFGFFCGNALGDTYTRLFLTMFGGTNFDPATKMSSANSPEMVQALQFLVDCNNEGLFAPGPETLNILDVYQMFLNKQLAVSFFNNVNYDGLKSSLERGDIEGPFDVKIMCLPNVGDPTCYAYDKGSVVFTHDNAMQTLAAKKFVDFYSHAPYDKASMAMLPLRKSLAQQIDDPVKKAIVESNKYAGDFWMQVPGYSALRPYFFPTLQAAMIGDKTPQEAMDDMTNQINELIQDFAMDSVFY